MTRGPFAMALRDKHYSRSIPAIVFYDVCRWCLLGLGMLLYRYRAYGTANIPQRGPVLLVANHQSFLDPPAIGTLVPGRHVDFVARIGLFTSKALAWLIRTLHAMPIRQDQPDTAAMKEALRRLELGAAVLVFPEGSRTLTGELGEFKRGVALLIKRGKCPVVPCAIDGAFQAWPRTRALPRLIGPRIHVAYGKPISPEELLAQGPDAAMERLHQEVAMLLAQLRRDGQVRRNTGAGARCVRTIG